MTHKRVPILRCSVKLKTEKWQNMVSWLTKSNFKYAALYERKQQNGHKPSGSSPASCRWPCGWGCCAPRKDSPSWTAPSCPDTHRSEGQTSISRGDRTLRFDASLYLAVVVVVRWLEVLLDQHVLHGDEDVTRRAVSGFHLLHEVLHADIYRQEMTPWETWRGFSRLRETPETTAYLASDPALWTPDRWWRCDFLSDSLAAPSSWIYYSDTPTKQTHNGR